MMYALVYIMHELAYMIHDPVYMIHDVGLHNLTFIPFGIYIGHKAFIKLNSLMCLYIFSCTMCPVSLFYMVQCLAL